MLAVARQIRALEHYRASMVFGRRSTLDSGALVWHAHCSLELGDVSAAKRDIFLLVAGRNYDRQLDGAVRRPQFDARNCLSEYFHLSCH